MSTSTSATYPGTASTEVDGGYSDWTNPDNIKDADADYALCSIASDNNFSYKLLGSSFDFAIPTGSIIDGIVVEIRQTHNGGIAREHEIKLRKAGSTVGNNKSTSSTYASATTVTYGGASDLWGVTWTTDDINNSGFGVGYKSYSLDLDSDTLVEFFRITIYYTPYIDSGIRYVNNSSVVKTIAAETLTASHKFRFNKGGTIVGLPLVATNASNAASIRVHDGTGVKSLVNL